MGRKTKKKNVAEDLLGPLTGENGGVIASEPGMATTTERDLDNSSAVSGLPFHCVDA
jgi:hypothetical protein